MREGRLSYKGCWPTEESKGPLPPHYQQLLDRPSASRHMPSEDLDSCLSAPGPPFPVAQKPSSRLAQPASDYIMTLDGNGRGGARRLVETRLLLVSSMILNPSMTTHACTVPRQGTQAYTSIDSRPYETYLRAELAFTP
jgi:hypothetical protein